MLSHINWISGLFQSIFNRRMIVISIGTIKEPIEKFTVIKYIYKNKRVHIQCESLYDDGGTKSECEPTSLH